MLASIPSPQISFFELFGFKIHFYALCILVGIVLAIWIADRSLSKQNFKAGAALDIALWTVPIGIIGARVFHVLTHQSDYFYPGADLRHIFYVWEGGIAIFGGLTAGALGAWLGAKRVGVPFLTFADAIAPGIILAQAFGRWGNYFNQELFGQPTTLPWGLEINANNPAFPAGLPAGTLFHPTFLYESIWNLAGFALLLWLTKNRNLITGQLFACYLAFYSFGRIWVEALRIDPSAVFFGLRTNIWSALAGISVGLWLWFWTQYRANKVAKTQ